MPLKKILKTLKDKVKKPSFGSRDKMDEALEEFEDYINLGIKPKPLQGPDLKSTSKIKTNPKIKKEVERERKEGYKGTDEEYYEEFYGPTPEGFKKGGLVKGVGIAKRGFRPVKKY
jgi:hypothetical protein